MSHITQMMSPTTSRVNIGCNPQKILSKGFIILSASASHGEFQKSLHKSDPGKGVNLHIFKMAANETNNVLLTVHIVAVHNANIDLYNGPHYNYGFDRQLVTATSTIK